MLAEREGMRLEEKNRRRCWYWGHKGVFFGSDSDYWLRQSGDVSTKALLRMEGSREKQREAGDDALREAGMRKVLRRESERAVAAIRGLPHISGCDFGNCS